LVLAQDREDEEGRYWFLSYMAARSSSPFKAFIDLMPYSLDRVAFARYVKYPERGVSFYSTAKLIARYYVIKT
jgi:hypothetical protein